MRTNAKLSSAFTIPIPKEVLDAQGWRAGQEFVFLPKGADVLLTPVPRAEQLQGIARGANNLDYRDRPACSTKKGPK